LPIGRSAAIGLRYPASACVQQVDEALAFLEMVREHTEDTQQACPEAAQRKPF
jgi:hypothetical protein